MHVEHVYRCARRGEIINVPVTNTFHILCTSSVMKAETDVLTDNNPSTHFCDHDKGMLGNLELIGLT